MNKKAEDDGITAYVPLLEGNEKLEKQGRFSRKKFRYDRSADAYRCPGGELLRPTEAEFKNTSGRVEIRYLRGHTPMHPYSWSNCRMGSAFRDQATRAEQTE